MLSRLELHHFKCFETLRLPLAPLTLLTGLNSSGKSSVLQSLVLLHQTMRELEWSTRLGLNGSGVRVGAALDVVDQLSGTNALGISVENDDNSCGWIFRGDRHDMSMQVEQVMVNGETMDQPSQLHYLLPPDSPDSAFSLARSLRGLTYITAERIAPQRLYLLEDPYSVDVVGSRGEHAVGVLHWGRDALVLNELLLPNAPRTRLRQVEERMRVLFPGCRLDLQELQDTNTVALGLRTSDATDFHSPIHTGFGLTQILPIVVAALSAARGDIILIENPEVHLHPAGQAQMGQFLADVAAAGVQVVVETHSDHVLNGVRRAVKGERLASNQVAIHFFRPRSEDNPQVLSPIMDDSGNIDEWPQGFFDQFDKDANYFAGWAEN